MKKIVILFLILIIFPKNVLAFTDTSKSSIVMDINSGRILYQKDSNTERLIASTTKIMTFLITITYAGDRLDEEVIVKDEVLRMYGTNMYLSLGEKIKIRDLLYGLMLRSGNDASVVLAVNVAGSIENFVYLMNEKAKQIGMLNTMFLNPHGLDEETKNYSTAYDLAILTRYLYLNYKEYKEIAGSKYYDLKTNLKTYSLTNRCKIMFTYENIMTAKNGYTPLAGKSLVTTATSNNLNLLIVTLDDYNIYENHINMYEYYFNKYQNYLILDKENFKVDGSILKDKYYIKNNFYYPITSEEKDSIKTKIIVNEGNDDILGTINILLNEEIIHEEKIYKKKEKVKEKKNIFKNVINFFKNFFK